MYWLFALGIFKGWLPTLDMILGFFDADGSFQARTYIKTTGLPSFYLSLDFTQKGSNSDVLEGILRFFGESYEVSRRQMISDEGIAFEGSRIGIGFKSAAGVKIFKTWKENPPLAPTKYYDYRITLILSQAMQTNILNTVNKNLPLGQSCDDIKVAGIALVWLREQMYGAKQYKERRIPIQNLYAQMGVTSKQIFLGEKLGKQLLNPIQTELDTIKKDPSLLIPRITNDRLLGYHIGDGSFYMSLTLKPGLFQAMTFKSRFFWSATDCSANRPLLLAIKAKLENEPGIKNLSKTEYGTYLKIVMSSNSSVTAFMKRWEGKFLPRTRQNQYNTMQKALKIYNTDVYQTDLEQAKELIRCKWDINPDSPQKKKGSLETDLEKIVVWFNSKKR